MTDSLKYGKMKIKSSNIELFKVVTLPDLALSSVKMYDSKSFTKGHETNLKPLLPSQGVWSPRLLMSQPKVEMSPQCQVLRQTIPKRLIPERLNQAYGWVMVCFLSSVFSLLFNYHLSCFQEFGGSLV
jgi:hypothetical protein